MENKCVIVDIFDRFGVINHGQSTVEHPNRDGGCRGETNPPHSMRGAEYPTGPPRAGLVQGLGMQSAGTVTREKEKPTEPSPAKSVAANSPASTLNPNALTFAPEPPMPKAIKLSNIPTANKYRDWRERLRGTGKSGRGGRMHPALPLSDPRTHASMK